MNETYLTKAIVLNRFAFREKDIKVVVYTQEKGKIELIARGAKKFGSKLAGHLEPMNFCSIMVVRGKKMDYAGAAISENSYLNIKNDLEKLKIAGRIINKSDKLIKPEEKDKKIFTLIKEELDQINNLDFSLKECELAELFFLLKLLDFLGYKPDFYNCVNCGKRISENKNKFDFLKGGVICSGCNSKKSLTISDDCVKILRVIIRGDFKLLLKININGSLKKEISNIINLFEKFRDI